MSCPTWRLRGGDSSAVQSQGAAEAPGQLGQGGNARPCDASERDRLGATRMPSYTGAVYGEGAVHLVQLDGQEGKDMQVQAVG